MGKFGRERCTAGGRKACRLSSSTTGRCDRCVADAGHGDLAGAAGQARIPSPNPSLPSGKGQTNSYWVGMHRARCPVNPAFVPLMEPAGLGWLDGFNELLCRCGLESNGPPEFDEAGRLLRPLHGRIANTPAHRVELIVDEAGGPADAARGCR